jgi:hypothetical protein
MERAIVYNSDMILQDRCPFNDLHWLIMHGIHFPALLVAKSDDMMWL